VGDLLLIRSYVLTFAERTGCLAIARLGRCTHQAMADPDAGARSGSGFVTRFSRCSRGRYAAQSASYGYLTFLMGAWIYTKYRIYVRIPIGRPSTGKPKALGRIEGTFRDARPRFRPMYGYSGRTLTTADRTALRKSVTACGLLCFQLFVVPSPSIMSVGSGHEHTIATPSTQIVAAGPRPRHRPLRIHQGSGPFAVRVSDCRAGDVLALRMFTCRFSPIIPAPPASISGVAGRQREGPTMYWYRLSVLSPSS